MKNQRSGRSEAGGRTARTHHDSPRKLHLFRNYTAQKRRSGNTALKFDVRSAGTSYDTPRAQGVIWQSASHKKRNRFYQDDVEGYPEYEDPELEYEGQELEYRDPELEYEDQGLEYEDQGLEYEGQELEYEDQGLEYEDQGLEYEGQELGYEESGLEYEGQGLEYEDQGLEYEDQGLEYEGQELGYEESGLEYEDQGLEYEDQEPGYEDQGLEYEGQELGYDDQSLEYEGQGLEYEDQGLEYEGQEPEYEDSGLQYEDPGLEYLDLDMNEFSEPEMEAWPQEGTPRKKKIVILAACFMVILVLAGFVYYKLPSFCVKSDLTIEAGDPCPTVSEFLAWGGKNAYIVSGIDEDMEFQHVQDYEVVIHLYHQDIATTLHVIDTVPPAVRTKDTTIMYGDPIAVEDFVESVSDITAYTISYREEPDIQGAGMYTVALAVVDEGGNVTEAEARLEVIQDVTPPVIEGVEEITITVGESVSYKRNITVTDDYDDAVKLEVDNSEVDTDTPGDYTIVYRATDKYGNMAEVSTILHVQAVVVNPGAAERPAVTEATVNAAADEILASITDPSMSQYEIIKAIYDWCHSKIAYVNGTSKSSWVEGAYAGLVLRGGDCYAYAMSAKCLLTRAGITNMDIERVPVGDSMHFWNLVDIGEGWHHFDTCRRTDGSTFFYLTDAELMAYSEAHTAAGYPNGTHYYDRSQYPEIP